MATNRIVEKEKIGVYAGILFDAAYKSDGASEVVLVRNQFKQLLSILYADLNVEYALTSDEYLPEQREELARAIFSDCNSNLREIIAAMAKNDDLDLLTRVYHAYEDTMRAKENLCVVDVETVVPLDDSLRDLIKKKTETDLGCKAELNESIDESLLGGIVMSVNGMRIDASVISQLNRARHVLKGTDGGENQ